MKNWHTSIHNKKVIRIPDPVGWPSSIRGMTFIKVDAILPKKHKKKGRK